MLRQSPTAHAAKSARERDRAIQEIRAEMSTLVIAATQQVLGEVIDADAHRKLIDKALKKVGDSSASKAQQN